MFPVFRWIAKHAEFRETYTLARETQAEVMAHEILDISDNATNDWMARQSESEKGAGIDTGWVLNGEHVQRSRIRCDNRKWLASKLLPKKYGDKLELAGDPKAPLKLEAEIELRPQLTADEWLKRQTEKK